MRIYSPFWGLCVVSLSIGLLTGCSASFAPGPVTLNQTPVGNIQGSVHGGQAPVSGAQIYLFAAGQGGYMTSASSLITSGGSGVSCSNPAVSNACYVTTDANGNFSVGGDYTCTVGQQVYMVAVGGNPGLSGTVNNTAIVQMAGLGQCPASGSMASQVPYLVIDEVTTVAFAYAMGGFATTAYNVSSDAGTSSLGATGIANAMANANNIVYLQWGQAASTAIGNSNSVVPQSKIYALANILATCVNTSSPSSTQCANLFKYATTASGTQATDEANAIFNIVHNPANTASNANLVANIWNLSPTTPVFSPTLSAQPADWTLPVVYKAAVGTPISMAFDTSGNAWIGDSTKGVVKIGPQGAISNFTKNQSNGNQAFGQIFGVAVAPNGTIWATDYSSKLVYIMNSAGVVTTTISTGNLDSPAAVAFDQAGNGFVVNEAAASISTYDSSGNFTAKDSYPIGQMNHPNWIAVDTTEDAWIPSQTNEIGELVYKPQNGKYKSTAYGLEPSYGLAFDGSGNLWVAGYQSNELDLVTGGSLQGTVKGSGLNAPQSVAIDGAGNIWVGNTKAAVISGFSNGSTPLNSAGLTTGSTGNTLFVTPDGSGNLWSANSDGTVSQILGVATPVATPIVPGNFGVKP